MKEKLKISLLMIPLLVLPILVNIWLIILYPVFLLASLFLSGKDFTNHVDKYNDMMAKIDKDES